MNRFLLALAVVGLGFMLGRRSRPQRPPARTEPEVSGPHYSPSSQWFEAGPMPGLRFVGRVVSGVALASIALAGIALTINSQQQAAQLSQPRLVLSVMSAEPLEGGFGWKVRLLVQNTGHDGTAIIAVHVQRGFEFVSLKAGVQPTAGASAPLRRPCSDPRRQVRGDKSRRSG